MSCAALLLLMYVSSVSYGIQALNDMKAINMLGVRQICRNCIALQQVLLSLNVHLFHSTSVSYSLLHFPSSFQH
jgi:hypothetical protein